MSVYFYAPVCFMLLVLFIYFVCKVLAFQQAFDKDDDVSVLRNRIMETPMNTTRQNRGTGSTDSRLFTISGRSNAYDLETPPKYEMPPSYSEAVSCGKTDNSAVISIERV